MSGVVWTVEAAMLSGPFVTGVGRAGRWIVSGPSPMSIIIVIIVVYYYYYYYYYILPLDRRADVLAKTSTHAYYA